MSKGFWDTLPKPFFALAPLADVTDAAFRRVIAERGKPDVFFTEFVSADGLCSPGRAVLLNDLLYTEQERPIVAQLFSGSETAMEQGAALVASLGFDGVDINMGCPDKSVEKQGAGAALMKNYDKAQALIRAAKRGAGTLPVSVKIRIGYNKNEIEEWLPVLLKEKPAAITVHARTRKEMSKAAAHWDVVARAVAIRNKLKSDTLIIGNGDASDLVDAEKKARESGTDGVMLGRAIFGNPWLFTDLPAIRKRTTKTANTPHNSLTTPEKLAALVEHTKLFEELLGGTKSFAVMKKHYKAYVEGFPGAKELRIKLMEYHNAAEVEEAVNDFLAAGLSDGV